MAMGISGALFCDFVAYTLKGLIITRTAFDYDYFMSTCCQNYYLQAIILENCYESKRKAV